jgi:hypothetical protein
MKSTPNRTCITQVAAIFVPVSNQDRALEFYLDKLGFEKRVDFTYGGIHRWLEVAPPGSTNSIALVPPSEGKSAGGDRTYCAFTTTDIESDHATLRARGVCWGLYQSWGCAVTKQEILAPAMVGGISGTARGKGRPVCHRAQRTVPEAAGAHLRRSNTSAGVYLCAD